MHVIYGRNYINIFKVNKSIVVGLVIWLSRDIVLGLAGTPYFCKGDYSTCNRWHARCVREPGNCCDDKCSWWS